MQDEYHQPYEKGIGIGLGFRHEGLYRFCRTKEQRNRMNLGSSGHCRFCGELTGLFRGHSCLGREASSDESGGLGFGV